MLDRESVPDTPRGWFGHEISCTGLMLDRASVPDTQCLLPACISLARVGSFREGPCPVPAPLKKPDICQAALHIYVSLR